MRVLTKFGISVWMGHFLAPCASWVELVSCCWLFSFFHLLVYGHIFAWHTTTWARCKPYPHRIANRLPLDLVHPGRNLALASRHCTPLHT